MMRFLTFRFKKQSYQFTLKIHFFLFCLFFFFLFCLLGTWQIHRYQFKKNLLLTYQNRITLPLQSLISLLNKENQDLQFRQVIVKGQYLNSLSILIENRFYKNKPGYEVLTPFQMENHKRLILIDRGWVPEPFPIIPAVEHTQIIQGHIKTLTEYQFILGSNVSSSSLPFIVMQKIDMKDISQVTGELFYPFILRLDASQSHGFVRDWAMTTIVPERHLGYAIQWFVMAFVSIIVYLSFCCERVEEDNDSCKKNIF